MKVAVLSEVFALLLGVATLGTQGVVTQDQQGVALHQGFISGIKVFTDARRPINAYLGIPYAAPPVGELRFAPPKLHPGWNRTLFAGSYGHPCPQLPGPAAPPAIYNEDCLTLNIWAPDLSLVRYREPLPVLVLLEGEGFISGSPSRLPAQDLAAEDIIVVSVSYRLNVFGFLCLEEPSSRGNLGLLDQYMALRWVQENIDRFGGDPKSVTLLGHSAGAASVVYHMLSPKATGLFQRAVIMSGSVTSPWLRTQHSANSSRAIARSLGCLGTYSDHVLHCLRSKSVEEILRAFETQFQNGNWSDLTLPVIDKFLPPEEQYLPRDPIEALKSGSYMQIPVLTGITTAEGALSLYEWSDVARQTPTQLRQLFDVTVLPQVLRRYGWEDRTAVREAIAWRYSGFEGLSQIMQILSDTKFVAPHYHQLKLLTLSSQPIYTYQFQQEGSDLYGSTLNVSGAAHGSELLYLLGPSLMLQATGRRPTSVQEQLGRSMRRMWADFARRGNPMPGQPYGYGLSWQPATPSQPHTYHLGSESYFTPGMGETATFWNDLLPRLAEITRLPPSAYDSGTPGGLMDGSQPFRSAVYTLVGIVAMLLVVLVVCLVLLKQRSKERQQDLF